MIVLYRNKTNDRDYSLIISLFTRRKTQLPIPNCIHKNLRIVQQNENKTRRYVNNKLDIKIKINCIQSPSPKLKMGAKEGIMIAIENESKVRIIILHQICFNTNTI